MYIHKEGYKIILVSTVLLVAIAMLLTALNAVVWLMALLGLPLLVLSWLVTMVLAPVLFPL